MTENNSRTPEQMAKSSAAAMNKSQEQQEFISRKSGGSMTGRTGSTYSDKARKTDQVAATEYTDGGGFDARDKLETGE
ncbi:hypothetical protein [Bhargavaea beijingensis]|uniref:Uncharacterized protein n=1 Tax=Bhargavaea beijingensis TaxID=426756 RepID=A0A1G7ENI9_9BACL|nr:hypothetical protein [Bhargavaea beijingensis]MCW1928582.1 hypothetical protein [Bhargavaea beijingensis]RSK25313.1 hypothetical protein EJA12_11505 [Bhargavaea beijingensis]SDE65253.1 hypothetical protein SAMN04488126_11446 [Bhargavaea beijingensis]